MMERAKSRWILVAVAAILLLSAFVIMGKVDADSEPPFIVLWGESDIKAITYHPETGLYCFETTSGSIDCECKCILEDTCDDEEKVLKEVTPTPGITPELTQTPTKEPTKTPQPTPTEVPTEEPTPTVVPTPTPGITPGPSPTPTNGPTPAKEHCNNGLGNGPDCPPPGHDKNGDGVADGPKGDNDDDGENRPCGNPGNPCNNKGGKKQK